MSGQGGGVRPKCLHHVCADCLHSVCGVSAQCVCGVKDGESERASYTHPNGRSSLTGGPGRGGGGGEDVPQRDTIGD